MERAPHLLDHLRGRFLDDPAAYLWRFSYGAFRLPIGKGMTAIGTRLALNRMAALRARVDGDLLLGDSTP
jgi:hypothetical protein